MNAQHIVYTTVLCMLSGLYSPKLSLCMSLVILFNFCRFYQKQRIQNIRNHWNYIILSAIGVHFFLLILNMVIKNFEKKSLKI